MRCEGEGWIVDRFGAGRWGRRGWEGMGRMGVCMCVCVPAMALCSLSLARLSLWTGCALACSGAAPRAPVRHAAMRRARTAHCMPAAMPACAGDTLVCPRLSLASPCPLGCPRLVFPRVLPRCAPPRIVPRHRRMLPCGSSGMLAVFLRFLCQSSSSSTRHLSSLLYPRSTLHYSFLPPSRPSQLPYHPPQSR